MAAFDQPPQLSGVQLDQSVRYEPLCSRIFLDRPIDPPLTSVEKGLVCGQSEGKTARSEGEFDQPWQTIPITQAIYQLKIFLQERAYHHPQIVHDDLGYIRVQIGLKTLLKRVSLDDASLDLGLIRKRDWMGRVLTPDLLNEIERWVSERLKSQGYPCPLVRAEANTQMGEVLVRVNRGHLSRILRIVTEPVPGLSPTVFRRFDAFELGGVYNGDLLSLTESRVAASGLVESTKISSNCVDSLEQAVISGAPRLIIARFGLNTEGLILGSFSWKNARLGDLGSFLEISAFGSVQRQSLASSLQLYYDPKRVRNYIAPQLSVTHRNEIQFETISTNAQIGWATTYDSEKNSISVFFGPILNWASTLRGLGGTETQIVSLEARFHLKSHDFEQYSDRPRSGYQLETAFDFSHQALFSQVSAQRFRLKGEQLWNLFHWDPPLWILGLRGSAATMLAPVSRPGGAQLPADFFQYLGGSHDLRGFSRLELSESARGGAWTSLYLGGEIRLGGLLPWSLDPFFFLDIGQLGTTGFSLNSPIYWSPGIGFRWASPVGAVRATAAHGFSNGTPAHFQLFFSLGEEF